jgi:hypothetical protein
VTGFVGGDTPGSATTGTLAFTTTATPLSPAGNYAINGSGLTAGNYTFVQASGNAIALTVTNVLLAAADRPNMQSPARSGSSLVLTSTNGGAYALCYLLVATNPAASLSGWTPVATNLCDSFGTIHFTNLLDSTNPAQFFILESP